MKVYHAYQRYPQVYIRGQVGRAYAMSGDGLFDFITGSLKSLASKVFSGSAKGFVMAQGKKLLQDTADSAIKKIGSVVSDKAQELASTLINKPASVSAKDVVLDTLASAKKDLKDVSGEIMEAAKNDAVKTVKGFATLNNGQVLTPAAQSILSQAIAGQGLALKTKQRRRVNGKFVGSGLKVL